MTWLLAGDVSIHYQTRRDLLADDRLELQRRIATEGWDAAYLSRCNPDGSWGCGFYQPKWTSTHYTLLDLKTLAIAPDHPLIRETMLQAWRWKDEDGDSGASLTTPQTVSETAYNPVHPARGILCSR